MDLVSQSIYLRGLFRSGSGSSGDSANSTTTKHICTLPNPLLESKFRLKKELQIFGHLDTDMNFVQHQPILLLGISPFTSLERSSQDALLHFLSYPSSFSCSAMQHISRNRMNSSRSCAYVCSYRSIPPFNSLDKSYRPHTSTSFPGVI